MSEMIDTTNDFYKRNWINNWLWRCCFSYLVVLIFITPIYKFGEVYLNFPGVNLSAVRVLIMGLTFFFLLFKIRMTKYERYALKSLIPAILSILAAIVFTAIAPYHISNYSSDAMTIYLTRVDILTGYIMMFLLGFYFDYQDSNKYKPYFFLMWIIFSAYILMNTSFLLSAFFYYDSGIEANISYILLSEAYVVLSIFTMTLIKNKYLTLVIWIITLVVLFFLPSRANTVGFILASVIVVFTWKRLLYGAILLPFLFMIAFSYISNLDVLGESRVLNTDISEDESMQARQQIEKDNVTNLKEHWFFGDFMGDVRLHRENGFYIHNMLSRWQDYSLFYLIFFLMAIGIMIYFLIKLPASNSFQYQSTLMLAVFSLPLVFFFRGTDLTLPYFVLSRVSVILWINRLTIKPKVQHIVV